ncbi:hypothetical protein VNO77_34270 [Canavalia gladiata]|uniref:Uncharacterized protein n=1 Tax=Canavalia gladiata TaxID=3824 RepID=A0AAN9KE13_CANGL
MSNPRSWLLGEAPPQKITNAPGGYATGGSTSRLRGWPKPMHSNNMQKASENERVHANVGKIRGPSRILEHLAHNNIPNLILHPPRNTPCVQEVHGTRKCAVCESVKRCPRTSPSNGHTCMA